MRKMKGAEAAGAERPCSLSQGWVASTDIIIRCLDNCTKFITHEIKIRLVRVVGAWVRTLLVQLCCGLSASTADSLEHDVSSTTGVNNCW